MAGWGPLRPAQIDFSDPRAPAAPDFGDVYHARAGAVAQARAVFLAGNGLPGRWQGRRRFTVLETGFGLGNTFLATWQAWRDDPQRPAELVFVSVEKHPPTAEDLRRAHAAAHVPAHAAADGAADAAAHTSPPAATATATGTGTSTATDAPPATDLAALAAELQAAWPPATPDLHLLSFDGGAVRLLLAFGDAQAVLPELQVQADAVFLDGFAPRVNAELWSPELLRHLPRLCAPDATLATWCVAGALRQTLTALGFAVEKRPGFGGKREMTVGRHAPRHIPPPPPGRPAQPTARRVAIVGAGLAGAAVARALARAGLQVTVLERADRPAAATSGNAGGLFHSVLHPDDGPHARWLRASALHTARVLRPRIDGGAVPGAVAGLLRGERQLDGSAMRARLAAQGQPAGHVQALDAAMPDGGPAWCYPDGGWVSPADLVRDWLAAPGITLHTGTAVERLEPVEPPPDGQAGNLLTGDSGAHSGGATATATATTSAMASTDSAGHQHPADARRWRLWAADGRCLAEVDAVVLCNAEDAARLAGPAAADWPLTRVRGQTTVLAADLPGLADLPLQRPLADGGYALRLHDGRVLCGAVSQPGDTEPGLRAADHLSHLRTLQRLTGWTHPALSPSSTAPDASGEVAVPALADPTAAPTAAPPAGPAGQADPAAPAGPSARAGLAGLDGRVGWRLVADDRLPLLGPVPRQALTAPAPTGPDGRPARPLTQVRQVAREPGLWLFIGLGSRGLTQAALAGELLAAQLTGAPWPVPLALAEALDPARFGIRAQRRGGRG